MHLLVNLFQKVLFPVGFVSDWYQRFAVLRMAAIRSQGSKSLKPLTQRKLRENWDDAWLLPRKTASKVSTSAASLDREAETSRKMILKKTKQWWVLSGFRLCCSQKRTDILRPLHALLSVSFFHSVSRCHGHTYFYENSSQAPFLLMLFDDLYVPNLNANPEKKKTVCRSGLSCALRNNSESNLMNAI